MSGARDAGDARDAETLRLRLYIAGNAPNSMQAMANTRTICDEHFPRRHELEIVDLLLSPDLGLADGIIVTPTLLKLHPPPTGRLVGNLSDIAQVIQTLGGR